MNPRRNKKTFRVESLETRNLLSALPPGAEVIATHPGFGVVYYTPDGTLVASDNPNANLQGVGSAIQLPTTNGPSVRDQAQDGLRSQLVHKQMVDGNVLN